MTPIERFAAYIVEKPFYPYQAEVANAIMYSIDHNLGHVITVMMARQSGKNQLSALIEAFLLFTRREGTIIKAAPTFSPQVTNSRRRLMSMLENPFCNKRLWTSYAQIGLAPSKEVHLVRRHVGPSVMFFSADRDSNVVGATASLLLEIDEAQDVESEKFDKDFRPMASTSNATSVMYGTAWSDETLLARQCRLNLEIERAGGPRRHFEYDWRACAASNPNYQRFVETEIERLGESHVAIQTQYYLRSISSAGFFFNDLQRTLLRGSHVWELQPENSLSSWPVEPHSEQGMSIHAEPATPLPEMAGSPVDQPIYAGTEQAAALPGTGSNGQEAACSGICYVAGLDVGGEERADPTDAEKLNVKRDSTVLTIGRVQYNELQLPTIEIVHQCWWTGKTYLEQYAAVLALCEQWAIRRLVIDNTGQGAGLASLLIDKLGKERVEAYSFTRPSKSKLGYELLALINSGRCTLYHERGAPAEIYAECWQQIKLARYSLPAPETINFYVEPGEGHDDFLISLALCARALEALVQPAAATRIPARPMYEGESRY